MPHSALVSLLLVVSCDQGLDPLGTPSDTSGAGGTQTTSAALSSHGRCGYIGYGDNAGYDAFKANAGSFDVIHPDWFKIDSDGVTVTPLRGMNDARVIQTAHDHGIPVIPLVAGVDDATPTEAMLDSASLRARHVATLVALATTMGYAGLDIDYEHLPPAYRDRFTVFMTDLATAMHAEGLEASVAVYAEAADASAYDYVALAKVLDHVHIMGYDYHWSGTHAGPLAPLGWIQSVASYAAATGHPAKFILAIPNYAYQPSSYCSLGDCPSACTGAVTATTTEMTGCSLNVYDHYIAGRAPSCMTAAGLQYFDDVASLEEKVAVARSAGLGGVGYWTLGKEPAGFFTMLAKYYL
jgi:spore germination protein YaaH